MNCGYRENTKKNFRSKLGIYSKFYQETGAYEFPANEWQLIRYACYTSEKVTSSKTVENYVGGIRMLHRTAGYEAVPASAPNLKMIMNCLKADMAWPTK